MIGKFLHETVLEEFGRRTLRETEVPAYIRDNLNPAFELRSYQEEAFTRFILCFENVFEEKEKPLHLLFNMATGSGKTLIMAGLILYFYEQGYRNFLFFVNSTNIITWVCKVFVETLILEEGCPVSIKYCLTLGDCGHSIGVVSSPA